MKAFFEHAPAIIAEAAKSPLGIIALMVLVLAAIGIAFFRRASERARISMFVLLAIGFAGFAAAVVSRGGIDDHRESPRQALLVRGIVLERETRRVLPGAEVLVATTSFRAVSGADGRFEQTLNGLPAQPTTLEFTAHLPGYATWTLAKVMEDPHGAVDLTIDLVRSR